MMKIARGKKLSIQDTHASVVRDGQGTLEGLRAETKQKDRYIRLVAWLGRRPANRGATHHGWQFTARSPGPLKDRGPLILSGWPPGCWGWQSRDSWKVFVRRRQTPQGPECYRSVGPGTEPDKLPCQCWSALQASHQSSG